MFPDVARKASLLVKDHCLKVLRQREPFRVKYVYLLCLKKSKGKV